MRRGSLFQIRGAEKRKAQDPNDTLCRGINSWWEEDERKDLVDWWCCKRSVRYIYLYLYVYLTSYTRVYLDSLCVARSVWRRWLYDWRRPKTSEDSTVDLRQRRRYIQLRCTSGWPLSHRLPGIEATCSKYWTALRLSTPCCGVQSTADTLFKRKKKHFSITR